MLTLPCKINASRPAHPVGSLLLWPSCPSAVRDKDAEKPPGHRGRFGLAQAS